MYAEKKQSHLQRRNKKTGLDPVKQNIKGALRLKYINVFCKSIENNTKLDFFDFLMDIFRLNTFDVESKR